MPRTVIQISIRQRVRVDMIGDTLDGCSSVNDKRGQRAGKAGAWLWAAKRGSVRGAGSGRYGTALLEGRPCGMEA